MEQSKNISEIQKTCAESTIDKIVLTIQNKKKDQTKDTH